jgi:hypothetical protein
VTAITHFNWRTWLPVMVGSTAAKLNGQDVTAVTFLAVIAIRRVTGVTFLAVAGCSPVFCSPLKGIRGVAGNKLLSG